MASVPVIESISGSKISTVKLLPSLTIDVCSLKEYFLSPFGYCLYIKRVYPDYFFISELEGLHLKIRIAGFQNCNKEGLVRTLWKNHSHEPSVIHTSKSPICSSSDQDPF